MVSVKQEYDIYYPWYFRYTGCMNKAAPDKYVVAVPKPPETNASNKITRELLSYIKYFLDRGFSYDEIANNLRGSGWSNRSIEIAFKQPSVYVTISKISRIRYFLKKSFIPIVIIFLTIAIYNSLIVNETSKLLNSKLNASSLLNGNYSTLIRYFGAIIEQFEVSWKIFASLIVSMVICLLVLKYLLLPTINLTIRRRALITSIVLIFCIHVYIFINIPFSSLKTIGEDLSIDMLVSEINRGAYPVEIVSDGNQVTSIISKNFRELTVIYPPDQFSERAISKIIEKRSRNYSNFVKAEYVTNNYKNSLPVEQFPAMFTIGDNALFIRSLDQKVLQPLLPELAKKATLQYFTGRQLKENSPMLRIVNESIYLKERDRYISEMIKPFIVQLNAAMQREAELKENLTNYKVVIAEQQSQINMLTINMNRNFYNCMNHYSSTYDYYTGISYYRTYTDEACSTQKYYESQKITPIQTLLNENTKNQKDMNALLSNKQKEIEELKKSINYYDGYYRQTVSYELGVFIPESSIVIMMQSTKPEDFMKLTATVVHEYLHFLSYSSEYRRLPTRFNEGLTAYFTNKIMQTVFHSNETGGYDNLEKDILEIVASYPSEELTDTYFKKQYITLFKIIREKFGSKYDEWLAEY